jgi:hypothetical protein
MSKEPFDPFDKLHSTGAHGLRLLDPYGSLHLSKLLFGFLKLLELVYVLRDVHK